MTRSTYIQKIIYRVGVLLFIMSSIANYFGVKPEQIYVNIDTLSVNQEITGWGTSSAWWSQIAGKSENADEIAKLLYSKEGLGLNIYRYNVGGGEKDNPNTRLPGNEWRATESFLVFNEEKGEYEYDWSKDKAAQDMLDKCMSYGLIDTVVLFANSPHYSMTVSGSATGGFEPKQSNLKKDCYDDFAVYMCDIAEYFISKGVPVKYISPINEPQWDWGGGWVGQEGCHYEIDEVIEVAKAFAKEIKVRNLPVKLSLAESGQVGEHAMDCIDKIYQNQDIVDVLGTYAYHSYWTDDILLKYSYGKYLKKNYPDTEIEMSEWCELPNKHKIGDNEAGLIFARTVSEDISLTGANSWTSWVAINDGLENADSMIGANGDCSELIIGKRYYAFSHFSKFVPAGSHAVDFGLSIADVSAEKAWWKDTVDGKEYTHFIVENKLNVSVFKTPDKKYVAVIVNEGEDKTFKFNMCMYNASVYTTDETRNLELTAESRGTQKVSVPANSIVTVVFDK